MLLTKVGFHLAVVDNKRLAKHQAASKGYRDQGVGFAWQVLHVPEAQVSLVGEVQREGGDAHGVLALGVQACPCGLRLMQQEQHRLVVPVEESSVPHLQTTSTHLNSLPLIWTAAILCKYLSAQLW